MTTLRYSNGFEIRFAGIGWGWEVWDSGGFWMRWDSLELAIDHLGSFASSGVAPVCYRSDWRKFV